jgi:hypothetical protein
VEINNSRRKRFTFLLSHSISAALLVREMQRFSEFAGKLIDLATIRTEVQRL